MNSLAYETHLPNEILLIIFDYLKNDDLCQLTDVSPHFCHLSLIIYFSRRKVTVSSDGQVDLRSPLKTRDMLPLLRKARFITSFDRFSCGLVQPHKSFLKDILDITAILRNVERVEEFVMEILTSGETWTPAMIKQVNAENALFNALNELLTAAARVSHSVTVRHGTSLKNILQKGDKSNGRGRWSLGPVTRLFSPEKFKRSSIPDVIHVTGGTTTAPHTSSFSSALARGNLRTLEIQSIILLSPPFLDWSVQTLRNNYITCLSFGAIDFRDVQWSSLLPRLETPALKVLTFRGHIPLGALVDFMSRHEGIAALTVNTIDLADWSTRSTSTGSASVGSSLVDEMVAKLEKAFASIMRLACCPQDLSYLLSGAPHPTNPTADLFPNLRYVSVLWNLGFGQQPKISSVNSILAPVASKLKTCLRGEFVIVYRADTGCSWRPHPPTTTFQRASGLFYWPVNLIHPTTFPGNGGLVQSSPNPASSVPGESHISLFSIFTEIKLEVTARADMEGIPALIKGLAETFACITHFRVDTRARSGRPMLENKQMKLILCHQILKHFRLLRVVHVDGTRCKVVERENRGLR